MRGLSLIAGASLAAAAVASDVLAAGQRYKRPARGGVFLAKLKEGAVTDKRGKAIKVTVLTHIRAGKFYKANGKREVARRLAQMALAWFNETAAMTQAQWDGLGSPDSPRPARYDADLVSA